MAAAVNFTVITTVMAANTSQFTATYTVSGENGPVIETSITAAATVTITGVAFPAAKCTMIAMKCDSSDCVVKFTNASGDTTINLTAGVSYLWTAASGAATPLLHDCTTMTVNNNGAQAVTTDFHARICLTS